MLDKTIEYFKSSAESLNENKYFIGFAMILLNIGARFIIDELDDDTRSLISYPYGEILCVLFVFHGHKRYIQSLFTNSCICDYFERVFTK